MATKAKDNKSVKNSVKNNTKGESKSKAQEEVTKVECDFTILASCKTMESLKAMADDIAAQLKDEYTKCAKALMPKGAKTATESKTTKTEKKSEKAESKSKKAKKVRSLADEVEQVAITDTAALKKLGVKFVRYTEKSCVLVGETKALHDSLLENFYGLKCITLQQGKLAGTKGWVFSNSRAEKFAELSGMKMPKAI